MPFAPPTSPHLRRVLEASAEAVAPARHAAAAFARDHGASPQLTADIALATSEACANVVRHAYADVDRPGRFELLATRRDATLCLRIADGGRGPWSRGDDPGLGLGLRLMELLSDACSISDARPGTVVELRFALDHPD
jgi:serine/threonine-protein kinase RsbW